MTIARSTLFLPCVSNLTGTHFTSVYRAHHTFGDEVRSQRTQPLPTHANSTYTYVTACHVHVLALRLELRQNEVHEAIIFHTISETLENTCL